MGNFRNFLVAFAALISSLNVATNAMFGEKTELQENPNATQSALFTNAYMYAMMLGKTDKWANAFANAGEAGIGFAEAHIYATQIEAGRSERWASAYAHAKTVLGQTDESANIYATQVEMQMAGGKSFKWASSYAYAITVEKIYDEWANVYATEAEAQMAGGKSNKWANAYAHAKVVEGRSDEWSVAYAGAIVDELTHEDAIYRADTQFPNG